MQPATLSTNSVSHADGRCPMPVDSSQGVALSMAKESFVCLIVLPSVLSPGGRIKDFSAPWICGNDSKQHREVLPGTAPDAAGPATDTLRPDTSACLEQQAAILL